MTYQSDEHARAGVSFLFRPGERPDRAALEQALAQCQAVASVTHDDGAGQVEVLASGLAFMCDGLNPASVDSTGPGFVASAVPYGFSGEVNCGGHEAVRLYPGPHLSGGLALTPVVRALLALAAELAVSMPVAALYWQPADTLIEPRYFSRVVLAWLAGGAFPAAGLTAMTRLADGSVVTHGLQHFIGYELTFRASALDGDAVSLSGAAAAVDYLMREGAPKALSELTIDRQRYQAETALHARQVLVWPEAAALTAGTATAF
ncbi:hypothetical protein GGR39_002864 [Novosphingobium fluoreni]|uniref:DUF4261 domain-containing protein n=1 Tax=Novosphingobium fluoreni TaxID=1391222 RepID=A0A7W6C0E0_9SPHN|nr:hypothetical protein [Novosphingobium fluoreni]MBB3941196.1 hypothetical protein [Novosphingobium fluoreni]